MVANRFKLLKNSSKDWVAVDLEVNLSERWCVTHLMICDPSENVRLLDLHNSSNYTDIINWLYFIN